MELSHNELVYNKICKSGDTVGAALPANDLKVVKDFNDLKDFTCGQSQTLPVHNRLLTTTQRLNFMKKTSYGESWVKE